MPTGGVVRSSRGLPCAVIPIGRVCGASQGTPWRPIVSRTFSCSITLQRRGDEALPLQVGLRAGEQQERRPVGVAKQVHREARRLVALPVVGVEDHQRTPGAVVEQLVDVEAHHQLRLERGQEVLAREPDGVPGVDEPVERLDQHRHVEIERSKLDEFRWVAHRR